MTVIVKAEDEGHGFKAGATVTRVKPVSITEVFLDSKGWFIFEGVSKKYGTTIRQSLEPREYYSITQLN